MSENKEVITKMMSDHERVARLAETFEIPVAEEGEEGTKVVLHYYEGQCRQALFNGGKVLEDKTPQKMVGPIVRYGHLRGMKGEITFKMIHKEGEYKLKGLTVNS